MHAWCRLSVQCEWRLLVRAAGRQVAPTLFNISSASWSWQDECDGDALEHPDTIGLFSSSMELQGHASNRHGEQEGVWVNKAHALQGCIGADKGLPEQNSFSRRCSCSARPSIIIHQACLQKMHAGLRRSSIHREAGEQLVPARR